MAELIRHRILGRLTARARRNPLAKDVALPVQKLIRVEQTAAVPLLVAGLVALAWANSPWRNAYEALWTTSLSFDLGFVSYEDDLRHWVNTLLMPLFFFVIGLEIKRELVHGRLRRLRLALFPVACAIGGVLVPVALFFALAAGHEASSAWGVVVATDIAFALAVLRLGPAGLPGGLASLILAFAVADDIIGVLVIAVFYSNDISFVALGFVAVFLVLVFVCRRLGIWSLAVYLLLGAASWLAIVKSGVHATILGVALGLLTPTRPMFGRGEATKLIHRVAERLESLQERRAHSEPASAEFERIEGKQETIFGYLETAVAGSEAPAERLTRWLNPWVGFFVLPVFALANAGIELSGQALATAVENRAAWGTVLGLLVGKPVGIVVFAFVAVRLGLTRLPRNVSFGHVVAMGALGGIGFTVSLFIADLAMSGGEGHAAIKLAILTASVLAGGLGWVVLRFAGGSAKSRNGGTHDS